MVRVVGRWHEAQAVGAMICLNRIARLGIADLEAWFSAPRNIIIILQLRNDPVPAPCTRLSAEF